MAMRFSYHYQCAAMIDYRSMVLEGRDICVSPRMARHTFSIRVVVCLDHLAYHAYPRSVTETRGIGAGL